MGHFVLFQGFRRLGPLFGCILVLSWGLPAVAENAAELDVGSRFNLRGFGTLGVARSTSNDAEFVRDLSQPRGVSKHWSGRIDTNLGVQANWRALDDLELVGQVASRYHYDGSRNPEVMWAFAKWEPGANVSLRAGRIGADFMMLADSRLVGYSSLTVRPSADFFGPLFFSHFDGADASLSVPAAGGIVRGKVFAGRTNEKAPYSLGVWDTSGSSVGGLVLDYQKGPWQLRGSVAGIRFSRNHDFSGLADNLRTVGATFGFPSAIAAADTISARNTESRFYSLGVVYDEGPLQIQGMLNHIRHESGVFQNSNAGYVLAGYRFGTLTPFAGVSWSDTAFKHYSTGLPSGGAFDALNNGFNSLMVASAVNQKTYTLGMRWDFRQDMALKVQWDGIRGQPESRFPFAHVGSGWKGRADVLSLSLDFIF